VIFRLSVLGLIDTFPPLTTLEACAAIDRTIDGVGGETPT
jgi:hypothetical protein